jgi:hypothetical protein
MNHIISLSHFFVSTLRVTKFFFLYFVFQKQSWIFNPGSHRSYFKLFIIYIKLMSTILNKAAKYKRISTILVEG